MNMRLLACYAPAIVVAVYAVIVARGGDWSRFAFLAVFAVSIIAHIRWGHG